MQLNWDEAKRDNGSYDLRKLALEFLTPVAGDTTRSNVLQFIAYVEALTPIYSREVAALTLVMATYRSDELNP